MSNVNLNPTPNHKVYGIDLGTTYSAISFINEHGKAEIIKNSSNDSVTPSVVFFESPENIIVGKIAKVSGSTGPEAALRVADFVKNQMSSQTWKFTADGSEYGPVEISSLILKRLVEDARRTGGHDVRDVVITCPAYFGDLERERTRQAGELIGLNVMEILDEPVAAAINYGLNDRNIEGKNIIVYDLGGGTIDVTIISIGNDSGKTEIRVICTEGDHQLGGKNWDDQIVQYYLSEFCNKTGIDIMQDTSQDKHRTLYDLRIWAEEDKKNLTERNEISRGIFFDGRNEVITLSREEFNMRTTDLLERTITLTDKALEFARSQGVEVIHSFLLVGGSTRMPQVEAKIIEKYSGSLGVTPVYFDVDEAVAKGAAMEALILSIKKRFLNITDPSEIENTIKIVSLETGLSPAQIRKYIGINTQKVATKSYGIEILGNRVSNLITKQTSVPTERKKHFVTADDNCNALNLVVYSNNENGEYADLSMCTKVGQVEFELPQTLGSNMPIDIQFTLTGEGKLLLYACDPTHNQTKEATFTPDGALTDQQMKDSIRKVGTLTVA